MVRLNSFIINQTKMSGGHWDYQEQRWLQDIMDGLKGINVGMNQPKNYDGLNKKYYQSKEKEMKVPKWVGNILEEYKDILHDIDLDVSGDSTIEKGFFEKKRQKLIEILKDNQ